MSRCFVFGSGWRLADICHVQGAVWAPDDRRKVEFFQTWGTSQASHPPPAQAWSIIRKYFARRKAKKKYSWRIRDNCWWWLPARTHFLNRCNPRHTGGVINYTIKETSTRPGVHFWGLTVEKEDKEPSVRCMNSESPLASTSKPSIIRWFFPSLGSSFRLLYICFSPETELARRCAH